MRLSAPVEVYWWMTSLCNLGCVFCMADGGAPYHGGELDEAGREGILREIIEARVLRVVLSGGEPMLLPDIYRHIRELTRAGVSVELTTNGTLVDADAAGMLRDAGLKRVQLSLNGPTPDTNDALMGESFGAITAALDTLVREGLHVSVKVTATAWNIADVPALVPMLLARGARRVKVADPTPMGRAFAMRDALTPSLDALARLKDGLERFASTGAVELGSFMLEMARTGTASRCSAGGERGYAAIITPDGAMAPCTMATLWPKRLKVTELGLTGAWRRLGEYNVEYLGAEGLGGACGSCGDAESCRGGCRPLAYLFTGDIKGEYPLCPMGG